MKRTNRMAAALAAALALAACTAKAPGPPPVAEAPPRAVCPDGPWRDAGVADGADGLAASRGLARLAACGLPARGPAADNVMDAYLSGHAEGVAIYCSAENAFALGRARKTPTLSCPAPLADRFATAYAAGLADASPPAAEPYSGWPVLRPSVGIGVGSGGRVSGGVGIGIGF